MSLKERLDRAARTAALSTADLATWLDMAYATVRSYRYGSEPYAWRRNLIEERVAWLEDAVENDPRLPVPLMLRHVERREYIRGIRSGYEIS